MAIVTSLAIIAVAMCIHIITYIHNYKYRASKIDLISFTVYHHHANTVTSYSYFIMAFTSNLLTGFLTHTFFNDYQ